MNWYLPPEGEAGEADAASPAAEPAAAPDAAVPATEDPAAAADVEADTQYYGWTGVVLAAEPVLAAL